MSYFQRMRVQKTIVVENKGGRGNPYHDEHGGKFTSAGGAMAAFDLSTEAKGKHYPKAAADNLIAAFKTHPQLKAAFDAHPETIKALIASTVNQENVGSGLKGWDMLKTIQNDPVLGKYLTEPLKNGASYTTPVLHALEAAETAHEHQKTMAGYKAEAVINAVKDTTWFKTDPKIAKKVIKETMAKNLLTGEQADMIMNKLAGGTTTGTGTWAKITDAINNVKEPRAPMEPLPKAYPKNPDKTAEVLDLLNSPAKDPTNYDPAFVDDHAPQPGSELTDYLTGKTPNPPSPAPAKTPDQMTDDELIAELNAPSDGAVKAGVALSLATQALTKNPSAKNPILTDDPKKLAGLVHMAMVAKPTAEDAADYVINGMGFAPNKGYGSHKAFTDAFIGTGMPSKTGATSTAVAAAAHLSPDQKIAMVGDLMAVGMSASDIAGFAPGSELLKSTLAAGFKQANAEDAADKVLSLMGFTPHPTSQKFKVLTTAFMMTGLPSKSAAAHAQTINTAQAPSKAYDPFDAAIAMHGAVSDLPAGQYDPGKFKTLASDALAKPGATAEDVAHDTLVGLGYKPNLNHGTYPKMVQALLDQGVPSKKVQQASHPGIEMLKPVPATPDLKAQYLDKVMGALGHYYMGNAEPVIAAINDTGMSVTQKAKAIMHATGIDTLPDNKQIQFEHNILMAFEVPPASPAPAEQTYSEHANAITNLMIAAGYAPNLAQVTKHFDTAKLDPSGVNTEKAAQLLDAMGYDYSKPVPDTYDPLTTKPKSLIAAVKEVFAAHEKGNPPPAATPATLPTGTTFTPSPEAAAAFTKVYQQQAYDGLIKLAQGNAASSYHSDKDSYAFTLKSVLSDPDNEKLQAHALSMKISHMLGDEWAYSSMTDDFVTSVLERAGYLKQPLVGAAPIYGAPTTLPSGTVFTPAPAAPTSTWTGPAPTAKTHPKNYKPEGNILGPKSTMKAHLIGQMKKTSMWDDHPDNAKAIEAAANKIAFHDKHKSAETKAKAFLEALIGKGSFNSSVVTKHNIDGFTQVLVNAGQPTKTPKVPTVDPVAQAAYQAATGNVPTASPQTVSPPAALAAAGAQPAVKWTDAQKQSFIAAAKYSMHNHPDVGKHNDAINSAIDNSFKFNEAKNAEQMTNVCIANIEQEVPEIAANHKANPGTLMHAVKKMVLKLTEAGLPSVNAPPKPPTTTPSSPSSPSKSTTTAYVPGKYGKNVGPTATGIVGDCSTDGFKDYTNKHAEIGALMNQRILTSAERTALGSYKGEFYRKVNGELRKGKVLSPDVMRAVAGLDTACSAGTIPAGTTIWRGIKDFTLPFGSIQNIKDAIAHDGGHLDHGYISCATEKDFSDHWGGGGADAVLFELKLTRDTPAVHVARGKSKNTSDNDGEYEVVLQRGTAWQVKGMRYEDTSAKKQKLIVTMEQL